MEDELIAAILRSNFPGLTGIQSGTTPELINKKEVIEEAVAEDDKKSGINIKLEPWSSPLMCEPALQMQESQYGDIAGDICGKQYSRKYSLKDFVRRTHDWIENDKFKTGA